MNKLLSSSSTLFKLSDTLPCLMEDECRTVELECDQTKLQLDGHMQCTHSAMEENTLVSPALVWQLSLSPPRH